MSTPLTLRFISRPGMGHLVGEMQQLADRCLDEKIRYQALSGEREALKRALIVTARDRDGALVGFCSGVLLHAAGLGRFLHMGLTCVAQEQRGRGLTGRLGAHLIRGFLLRHRPFGRVWLSCVACVKSSLGNVALHFDHVFPSPFCAPRPSKPHLAIAEAISRHHRRWIHIRDDAHFDATHFVFRGGARDTVFQKRRDDPRYLHRHPKLNQFYDGLMDFEQGDLVLQVCSASALTGLRHAFGWGERSVDFALPAYVPGK
ncbi:MAG: hypothetical protein AAFY60_00070 [Myxococcota bacterium]